MPGIASILARIKTDIQAVAGIDSSLVHLGQRLWLPEQLIAYGQDTAATRPQIHVWMVCPGLADEIPYSTSSRMRQYRVTIKAWYQVRDPATEPDAVAVGTSMTTELLFLNLVEGVCDKLRNDAHLTGGDIAEKISPPTVTVWSLEELEGIEARCHYCEIELTAEIEKIFVWES